MGVNVDWANAKQTNVNGLDLDTVYITGAGYVKRPFKGIDRDSAMGWGEPVWGGDLTRSTDFTLSNIDDVDFGIVARVELSYKLMNYEDYKALCEIAKQRVCYVIYFDRESGEWVTGFGSHAGYGQEMAFTGNELGKLYTYGSQYLGSLDVKIKLVATNRDKTDVTNQYTVSYNANGGSGSIPSKTVTWGENVVIADGSVLTPPTGSSFLGWKTSADGVGINYTAGQNVTLFKNLNLYASWGINITNNLTNCSTSNPQTQIGVGDSYYAVITPDEGYSLQNNDVQITMNGQDVTSYYNNGIINIPSVTGSIQITIICYENGINPVFSRNDWATIKNAAQSGNIPRYGWSLGDTKDTTISYLGATYTIPIRIADMSTARYTYSGSSNTTNIVFEMVNVFWSNDTTMATRLNGGWRSSQVRSFVNSTIYNGLQSELKNILEQIDIPAMGSSGIIYSQDKLFIPSAEELAGAEWRAANNCYAGEGSHYEYYAQHSLDVDRKKTYPNDTTYGSWFTRSPMSTETYEGYFWTVGNNGILSRSYSPAPSYTDNISLCFAF